VRDDWSLGEQGASDASPESDLAAARARALIGWVSLAWVLLCAGQSLGLYTLFPNLAYCHLAGWLPEAAALAALCSVGAMGFAALSGVLVNTSAGSVMNPSALQVPIALIVCMTILFVFPAVAWAFAWSPYADSPDMIRGFVVSGSIALPQFAATLSLAAAYFWSPRAKSRHLAALWPLTAWSGCVLLYLAVMAAVQVPRCFFSL
jgi:hypothetical protein